MVESGFWGRVGRLGTVWGYFYRSTSERQLRSATGSRIALFNEVATGHTNKNSSKDFPPPPHGSAYYTY